MPLSFHQLGTYLCSFEQESRKVQEMRHRRVAHMKEHETKYDELV